LSSKILGEREVREVRGSRNRRMIAIDRYIKMKKQAARMGRRRRDRINVPLSPSIASTTL
jgi:hypothetical protein